MPEIVYLNGEFVTPEKAVIPFNDRGFLFGDAVYEVVRSYGGCLFALDRHLARLERSLREIEIRNVKVAEIGRVIEEACRRSGFAEVWVYVQVTRGAAPRKHDYDPDLLPTILVHVRDLAPLLDPSIREGVAVITAPDMRWRRCDIKTTNLLPNVLAKTKAREQGAFEAILVNQDGMVTEATSAGVFCVEQGVVLTHPLSPAILPSITREAVLEAAGEEGVPVREEPVSLDRLRGAEEVFLVSTTDDVCPVITLDGAPVGDGRPGPVTRRLLAAYLRRVGAAVPEEGGGRP